MDSDIRPIHLKHKPGVRLASFLVCDCGHDSFHVFQVQGQEHDHLTCPRCRKTYCFNGRCTDADYQ